MLLHVNNEMENGIIAKIPLALDKDVKGFQGDAIVFQISSLDGRFIPAEEIHPYKSLFKVLSGNSELKTSIWHFRSISISQRRTAKKPRWRAPFRQKTGLSRMGIIILMQRPRSASHPGVSLQEPTVQASPIHIFM
ncbi:hypothetical protein [Ochrobactrum quorumnocens]|uniref:hypothetical protein n=1 Tax=Ochrobactrum quorumnocens TaxID=271865 RepID=UPI001FD10429|nr:hypothetical protein [[Ochrobactrum] quorumnocens]